jgi:hypothetical protein
MPEVARAQWQGPEAEGTARAGRCCRLQEGIQENGQARARSQRTRSQRARSQGLVPNDSVSTNSVSTNSVSTNSVQGTRWLDLRSRRSRPTCPHRHRHRTERTRTGVVDSATPSHPGTRSVHCRSPSSPSPASSAGRAPRHRRDDPGATTPARRPGRHDTGATSRAPRHWRCDPAALHPRSVKRPAKRYTACVPSGTLDWCRRTSCASEMPSVTTRCVRSPSIWRRAASTSKNTASAPHRSSRHAPGATSERSSSTFPNRILTSAARRPSARVVAALVVAALIVTAAAPPARSACRTARRPLDVAGEPPSAHSPQG